MKEPFFGVIPIGATQDIDYAQCGWVVASGQWPLRNFVFVF